MAALIYFLFFADWFGHAPGVHGDYHYNLVPFAEIRRFLTAGKKLTAGAVFLNLGGNIIGFIPFGFFLPVIDRHFRSVPKVTFLGMLLSAAVELTQLVPKIGTCDVDDVILNTLGTLIGVLLFMYADILRIRKEKRARRDAQDKG